MRKIIKELPYPPTINHYYSRQANGAVYIGIKGKTYRKAASACFHACKPIEGKVRLHVDVYPPDKKRRDLDNLLKCLQDSIQQAGIIKDDYDIDELSMKRFPSETGGKVIITLSKLDHLTEKASVYDYDAD